jgi:uncharacterized protein YbjQ (UPF0145 family)
MKIMYLAFSFLLISFVVSCTTPTISPEVRRIAANIKILNSNEISSNEYRIIGEAFGISCGKQLGNEPSMEMANQNMIINAAELGADAIINVMCEETGIDWKNNCWESIQCRGDAIIFKK